VRRQHLILKHRAARRQVMRPAVASYFYSAQLLRCQPEPHAPAVPRPSRQAPKPLPA
jgi:hypothetical protein